MTRAMAVYIGTMPKAPVGSKKMSVRMNTVLNRFLYKIKLIEHSLMVNMHVFMK